MENTVDKQLERLADDLLNRMRNIDERLKQVLVE